MKRLLPVLLLAVLPLGALAASSTSAAADSFARSATQRSGSDQQLEELEVARVEVLHMMPSDLEHLLEFRFRGALWTRVEPQRGAVLLCGTADMLATAAAIAAKLDVPPAAAPDARD